MRFNRNKFQRGKLYQIVNTDKVDSQDTLRFFEVMSELPEPGTANRAIEWMEGTTCMLKTGDVFLFLQYEYKESRPAWIVILFEEKIWVSNVTAWILLEDVEIKRVA